MTKPIGELQIGQYTLTALDDGSLEIEIEELASHEAPVGRIAPAELATSAKAMQVYAALIAGDGDIVFLKDLAHRPPTDTALAEWIDWASKPERSPEVKAWLALREALPDADGFFKETNG